MATFTIIHNNPLVNLVTNQNCEQITQQLKKKGRAFWNKEENLPLISDVLQKLILQKNYAKLKAFLKVAREHHPPVNRVFTLASSK